jgi:hypothetical protein
MALANDIQTALETEYEAAHPDANFAQAATFAASWVEDHLGAVTDSSAVRHGFAYGVYYLQKVLQLISAEELREELDRLTAEIEFLRTARLSEEAATVAGEEPEDAPWQA